MADEELLKRRPWLINYDWKVPWTLNYPKFPAWELLRNTANLEPNKEATWFYGTTITYLELYRTCVRLANKLIELGVKKGDRIGVHLPDCPQFNIAYWSVLMAGAVVVNMNPMYTTDELIHYADNTSMTGLFTFDAVLPRVKPLCKAVNIPLVIVTRIMDFVNGQGVSTREELGLDENWHHLTRLIEQSTNKIPPRIPLKPDDPAVIQFTGGTTGVAKGAVLTQSNIVVAAVQVTRWGCTNLDDAPVERRWVLCILPFFHVYGEVCCILYCTFAHATQVILPRFDVDEVIDTMNYSRIHILSLRAYHATRSFGSPRIEEVDLSKRAAFVGTGVAPCPLDLIQQALDMDIYYSEGWGMSETTSLGISNPVQGEKKPLSIGFPFIDMEIRLVDPVTLKDVPQGERGEIWIEGPDGDEGVLEQPGRDRLDLCRRVAAYGRCGLYG